MITTHVLDISRGGPAAGITVILEIQQGGDWSPVGRGITDATGRLITLMHGKALAQGTYRLTFDTGAYHLAQGMTAPFFPEVKIAFTIEDAAAHYHVPLLLSPYGYSTYRGT